MDLAFFKIYFTELTRVLVSAGIEQELAVRSVWAGTKAMIMNDGKHSNEEVFWNVFSAAYPDRDLCGDQKYFDEFYKNKFDSVKDIVAKFEPLSVKAVEHIKAKGLRTVLATNPLFPSIATEKRMAWAGFSPADFEFFTSYENSTYSKPSLGYYECVVKKLGLEYEECLMVGNDVSDDMVAEKLGMKVFLLTDRLINKDGADISVYPNGSFEALCEYIDSLI